VVAFKPDLIHGQHLWVAPYAASMTGLPYIITAHGTDIKGFKSDKRFQNIALKGAHDAKKVFTISGQVNKDVKKYYDLPAEKLNTKSIFFLGNQTQKTLARLYNIADVSVVPSRMEPFGLVAIESLACGTPVIA
jgi:hypothetical protein